MIKTLKSALNIMVSSVIAFQLMGCGTILYPERKGQKSGKIDAGVAVLDGIGLLFFVIPGVIAFAVDFNNGTIYLPGTSRSSLDADGLKQVKFAVKDSNLQGIERIIKEETGSEVKLDGPEVHITQLKSTDVLIQNFEDNSHAMRDTRLVLNR